MPDAQRPRSRRFVGVKTRSVEHYIPDHAPVQRWPVPADTARRKLRLRRVGENDPVGPRGGRAERCSATAIIDAHIRDARRDSTVVQRCSLTRATLAIPSRSESRRSEKVLAACIERIVASPNQLQGPRRVYREGSAPAVCNYGSAFEELEGGELKPL